MGVFRRENGKGTLFSLWLSCLVDNFYSPCSPMTLLFSFSSCSFHANNPNLSFFQFLSACPSSQALRHIETIPSYPMLSASKFCSSKHFANPHTGSTFLFSCPRETAPPALPLLPVIYVALEHCLPTFCCNVYCCWFSF